MGQENKIEAASYLITEPKGWPGTAIVAFPGSHNVDDWMTNLSVGTEKLVDGWVPAGEGVTPGSGRSVRASVHGCPATLRSRSLATPHSGAQ